MGKTTFATQLISWPKGLFRGKAHCIYTATLERSTLSCVCFSYKFYHLQVCQLQKYRMPITRAEIQRETNVQIENYGTKFDVRRTNVHRYTNIFIQESNPFYPYETLPVYCVAPLWFAAVGFLCSMGGAANLTAAIIGLIFDVPFLATYCQNEVVNRRSLPIVMKQKTVDNLPTLNALWEVTVEKLRGIIGISTDGVEIGLQVMQSGKFKLQVSHPAAFTIMDKAKDTSRFLLTGFVVAALYNIICTIVHSLI